MPDDSRPDDSRPDIGSSADGGLAVVTGQEQEQLLRALHRHLADGRLDLAGFDERVRLLYAGRTRVSARAALEGLPLLAAEAPGPGVRGRRGRRRHGEESDVQPHWVATDEVFRDPTTRRVMRVWVDPVDGSRHYLQADRTAQE